MRSVTRLDNCFITRWHHFNNRWQILTIILSVPLLVFQYKLSNDSFVTSNNNQLLTHVDAQFTLCTELLLRTDIMYSKFTTYV